VLLLDDLTTTEQDLQMRSIAHGVLVLEQTQPRYGAQRRRLQVLKYRGVQFRGGYHDYSIVKGGLRVFPRLVAAEHRRASTRARLSSDVPAIDALLGGGIEEGTSTLLVGAAGTGKSTIAAQFAWAAARRGQRSALFLFDESPQTLLSRCREVAIDLEPFVESGMVTVTQVDPAELTPGEFTHAISAQVDQGAKIIVIDSLNGYLNAMPEEGFLTIYLHELLMYLGQRGVAAILISAQQGLIGQMQSRSMPAISPTPWCCCATSRRAARCGRRFRSSRSAAAATSARSGSLRSRPPASRSGRRCGNSAAC
jgi:circadian clock protein KaiC